MAMWGVPDLRFRAVGLGAVLALAVALLTGCGGAGSSEASSSTPLSKQEFLKQGNALCDTILAERDSRVAKTVTNHLTEYKRLSKAGRDRVESKLALEIDLPLYRKLVHKLGELTPPAKDKKTVEKMLLNYEALLDRLFEHPEELREVQPFPPNKEAVAYGLISCFL